MNPIRQFKGKFKSSSTGLEKSVVGTLYRGGYVQFGGQFNGELYNDLFKGF
jgi:hypothetical protein